MFPLGEVACRGEPVDDMPQLTDMARPQQTRPQKSVETRCSAGQLRSPPLEFDLFARPDATSDEHGHRFARIVDRAGLAHLQPPQVN